MTSGRERAWMPSYGAFGRPSDLRLSRKQILETSAQGYLDSIKARVRLVALSWILKASPL